MDKEDGLRDSQQPSGGSLTSARKETELAVRADDSSVTLADVLEILTTCGINVLACSSYCDWHGPVVLVVTKEVMKAKRTLEAAGLKCTANSVIMVASKSRVGAVAWFGAQVCGAGIDILYSYASALHGERFCAVFKTADDDRALRALAETHFAQAA